MEKSNNPSVQFVDRSRFFKHKRHIYSVSLHAKRIVTLHLSRSSACTQLDPSVCLVSPPRP